MNIRNKTFKKISIGIFIYGSILAILLYNSTKPTVQVYYNEYLILLFSYLVVGLIMFYTIIKYKIDVFQPFILISILYLFIFTITPMVFIIQENTQAHGVDIMDGCIKATIIYMISYIAFSSGYILKKFSFNSSKFNNEFKLSRLERKYILIISYLIWIVSYFCSAIYMISIGRGIVYMLTFGAGGTVKESLGGGGLAFISNFSYCMIIPLIYIIFFSKSKLIKFTLLYITLSFYISRGFRFIIVILIGSIIISWYRKRRTKPSVTTIAVLILSFLLFIAALGYARRDLKNGNDVDWSSFGIENITYALESNFDIYKPFYGIVSKYPSEFSYTYGRALIGETITMFVPRAIWPNKPLAENSSVLMAIRRSVSDFAVLNAGMAVPNIAEFYIDFGIIGCIILMFIFGYIAKYITKYYFVPNNNIHYIILYSVIMPTFMQLVIRGYMPSNFYLVLFLIMPSVLIRYLVKVINR